MVTDKSEEEGLAVRQEQAGKLAKITSAAQCDKKDRRGRSRSKPRTSNKSARDHSVGSGHGFPMDFPNTEHSRRGRSSSRSKYDERPAVCCPNCSAKTDGIMMLFSDMDDEQPHRVRSRSSSIMSRASVNSIPMNMDQGTRGRTACAYPESSAGGRRERSSSIMSRTSVNSLPMCLEDDPRILAVLREIEASARRERRERSTSKPTRSRSSSRDRSVDLAMAAALGRSLQVEEECTVRRPHIGWDGDVHHPETTGYAMPEKMMATYKALSSRGRSPSVERARRRVPVPPPPPRESSLPSKQSRSKSFEARHESCLPLPPIKPNLSIQPSTSFSRESSQQPPPYRHESALQAPLRSNSYVSSQMQQDRSEQAGYRMYPQSAVEPSSNVESMNRSVYSQNSSRSRLSSSSKASSKKHSYCLTSELEKQVATYKQDTCVTVPTFKSRSTNNDWSDSRSMDSSMSSRASEASLSSMEGSERSGTSSKKRVQFSPNTKPGTSVTPDDSSVNSLDSSESESSSMSFEELLFELFGSNTNPDRNNATQVSTGLASLKERHNRKSIKIRTEDEKPPPPPVAPRMRGYGKMYSNSHMPREGLGDCESLPSMASSSISSDSRNSRSNILDRQSNNALLSTARDIINDATDYSKRRSGFILDED
eukprot:CCRYP_018845-RA/>CCRYP_018845-RA protein AED:0.00 eAED:0.00 QI:398/1/1/1/0/0/2/282/652